MINSNYYRNKTKWLLVSLLLFVLLALFPYGWLAERWRLFGVVTDFIFATELAHVIGHLVLYAAVGTAVLFTFPRLQKHPRLYFTLIFWLGLAQEILQLVSFKQRPFASNEIMDITVDLLGALIAYQFFRTQINTD